MQFVAVFCFVVAVVTAHHGHSHSHSHNHGHGHNHGEQPIDTSKPPITVSRSGEFHGAYMTSRRGRQFESYRGIRYAEPPVGELRFQPPKEILRYNKPVNASEDGPACPLPAPPNYPVDEDCLTVNVYTPLKSHRSKKLPVIFFMHPGGFYSMTGRSDLAGPHYLLDRDVVLVTMNYRLGSLGFLSTGDELAPGNNGYKDQVAAMKWVQRNIEAFGGDKNCVTITGSSAGSFSVMLHMISPMSKGLFHRGISMSGSPIGKVPLPHDLRSLAVKQAELLNCTDTSSSRAIIDCLKTKTWKELGDSLPGFFEFGFDPVGLWLPIVENDFGQERFLPIEPIDAIKQGKMHAVPYIISQTQDEFFWFAFSTLRNETLLKLRNEQWDRTATISFLLPRENSTAATQAIRKQYLHDEPLRNDAISEDRLGRLYADSIVGMVVNRLVKLMTKYSPKPVWYYQFGYVGNHSHYEDPTTGKPTRPAHHDDLIYLFTLRYRFPDIGLEGLDAKLVDKMTALWYNFARYADPNPRGDTPELGDLCWPAATYEDRTYMRVDKEFSLHKNLYEDRYQFWDELYPIEY